MMQNKNAPAVPFVYAPCQALPGLMAIPVSELSECVVMPCYKRIEMLALALEHLDRTNRKNLDIRIFVDTTTEERIDEVEYVRNVYYPDAIIFHAKPHPNVPSGMWNILNALKQGYETGASRVYLVEEDTCVHRDYFTWHDEAQVSGDFLATCGRYHRPGYEKYTNPGSCFKREMLAKVVEHIVPDLFVDRRAYMDHQFGKMDELSDLDDGLIRRIAKFHGLKVKYPDMPKCSHIGFMAYNHYRGWENTGNIRERIVNLRKMLNEVDPKNRYTKDFEPLG